MVPTFNLWRCFVASPSGDVLTSGAARAPRDRGAGDALAADTKRNGLAASAGELAWDLKCRCATPSCLLNSPVLRDQNPGRNLILVAGRMGTWQLGLSRDIPALQQGDSPATRGALQCSKPIPGYALKIRGKTLIETTVFKE